MKLDWRPQSFGTGPTISTSLTQAEITRLQELAAGATVLEIGSAYGYSAVAMALAGAHVTAVDGHTWLSSLEVMTGNLAAYGVSDTVDMIVGWSHDVLPTMIGQRFFDLIWIDGDHSEAAVISDVNLSLSLLKETGVLACHDYGEITCPGVKVALDKVLGPPPELTDTLAVYQQPIKR